VITYSHPQVRDHLSPDEEARLHELIAALHQMGFTDVEARIDEVTSLTGPQRFAITLRGQRGGQRHQTEAFFGAFEGQGGPIRAGRALRALSDAIDTTWIGGDKVR
jgi:hypothetical protein